MKLLQGFFNKKIILLFLLLFLFWLVLSPGISTQTIVAGLLISFCVALYNQDLAFEEGETSFYSVKGVVKLFRFIIVLLVEIIKANIDVAKIVLSPSMPISPCFVKVPLTQKKDMNRVLYANSITLTPGTLSVDMNEEEILVHALTKEAAEGMDGNVLDKYITQLEEE